ncbi:helix-turn-helix domain-containing protein [Methylobacterium sp. Leaf118]|uniref:helix-turn-helix domain-containing protein n=1 Tax=Methylobacterium sp. Leaf118 TaxID=2876562 RepID=UPI001E50BCD9|nr:helix-turn-helix domain-containing protein [Methylobacterium sp. Leaf118]
MLDEQTAGSSSSARKPGREIKHALTPIAYRPGDAAHVLGVSRSTIYKMMADGDLEARHLGGATLIAHEELLRVLRSAPLTPHTKFAQASIK